MPPVRPIVWPIASPVVQRLLAPRRPLGPVVPPVTVANQTLAFGALTRAGHGGIAPSHSGNITTASIVSGNDLGHWQIAADGAITPTSAGQASGLSGPYALVCDFGDGTDTVQATVTVETQADTYSVGSYTELQSVLQAVGLVSFGQRIKLRSGVYNSEFAQTRIRPVAFNGAIQHPVDSANWYAGADLNTSNYVKIMPHAGSGVTFCRLVFDGYTSTQGGLWFKDLNFAYSTLDDQNSSNFPSLLEFMNGLNAIAISGCAFQSTPSDLGSYMTRVKAIGGGGEQSNFYIQDSEFSDLVSVFGGTVTSFDFIGNTLRRIWYDGLTLVTRNNHRVHWNDFRDKKHPPAEVGAHADYFQWISGGNSSYDNISAVGNVMAHGDGSAGMVDGQGIFIADTPVGYELTNVQVIGNLYVGSMANGIAISRANNPAVKFNTVLRDRNDVANNYGARILLGSGTGGEVAYNITDTINDSQSASLTGNTDTHYNLATSDPLSYESLFADPQFGALVTDPLTQFAIKSGSVADASSPKPGAVGSGVIDFVNRTVSLPVESAPLSVPTIRSTLASNGPEAATYNVPLPADIQSGDVIEVRISQKLSTSTGDTYTYPTLPGGWARVAQEDRAYIGASVFTKVADGTEGGTTVLASQAHVDARTWASITTAISGASETPHMVASVDSYGSSLSIPAMTTTENCLLIASASSDRPLSELTPPASPWTLVEDEATSSGFPHSFAASSFEQESPGSRPSGSFAYTNGGGYLAILVAYQLAQ